ncbi:MAG: glycosyl hydrolase [Gaiellaceae bacterium]
MAGFAGIVEEGRRRGYDCITHLTIQNEVNSVDIAHQHDPKKSMELYRLLYEDLDESLRALPNPADDSATLRDAVQLVGGDLVERGIASQDDWLRFMQEQMASLLDGYSIHVYWVQGDFKKFEKRLSHLLDLVAELKIEKPIYVTEYGVKASNTGEPGTIDGMNVEHMVETAFEHAWFNALAPQFGCVGLSKWALYRTDGSSFGGWGMIDAPSKNFARTPTYRVTWLFDHLTEPGWKAAGLGRGSNLLVGAFRAPNGNQSVVTLNRRSQSQQVRVEGLQPGAGYFAAVWNREGDGALHALRRLSTDAVGAATITVPGHGLVALSQKTIGFQ